MDELYHHGIKGQKWGIRRFENPDGTLTPEGKARYRGENSIKQRLSMKLKDPKVQKAIKIGAAVAGSALAIYGGYKFSQYMNDQKVIMALNEHSNTIKKIIPQYAGNISAMKKGYAPSTHLNEYVNGLKVNKQNLSKAQAEIGNISKKHIYNFGKNFTLSQYNSAVNALTGAGKAVAKGTGKAALAIGKATLKFGKETVDYLLANSASIAEILEAMN